MKNEAISERQAIILIILFILGNSLLVGSGDQAKQDVWLAIIISIFVSVILYLMLSRILSLYPGKDLFDILEIVMGKYVGKIISLLMIWFAFHTGTLVLRIISEFTVTSVLDDTPVVVPMIFFAILLIWCLKAGIEVLGRWSEFFGVIIILIVIIVPMLSVPQMDINRLKPILYNAVSPLLKGTFASFSFPFAQAIIFTMVFSNISKIKNYNKTFIVGLLIGGGLLFLTSLRNLLVLGSNTISNLYFHSPTAVGLIDLGILQRFESTVIIVFLVCGFVKVSICIFAVCNGISKVFDFNNYKFVATPVTLLMLSFSFFVYKNIMEMKFFASKVWPYYSFPFQVIIPLIIFIMAEIKSRKTTAKIVTK
ncbi:endospore germination permease [Clostridium algoriphilum]|uniref:GerAB/ArcD/ProY family transporter n=1 Tax=Clostridium algoriphilum TaxID=198347 RepID=UPI001CF0EB00|nr:endospore germination permease [Clostridium algoriphilum]MCB2293988.1 endospore germination permease [Clostridium algoriphilum]